MGIKSHNVTAIKDRDKQSSSWGFKFNTCILKVILLFKKRTIYHFLKGHKLNCACTCLMRDHEGEDMHLHSFTHG